MAKLNQQARETLALHGMTEQQWAQTFFSGAVWFGDLCGCPDDRCITYHHDNADDCGCLSALLDPRSPVSSS